jgi:hypothetical protein
MLRKIRSPASAGDFLGIHSGNGKNKGPFGPVIDNT